LGGSVFPGLVQSAQAAAKGLDLLLVRGLLPFSQLHGFQHFLHVVECGAEGFDDVVDLFNGVRDCRWRGGLKVAGWGRRSLAPGREGSLRALFALCAPELHSGSAGIPAGCFRSLRPGRRGCRRSQCFGQGLRDRLTRRSGLFEG
jgi:hypothetical protein